MQTSIQVMDLESGETRELTDHDPRVLHVTGWPEPERLRVIDQDRQQYLLNIDSGDLQPEETPQDLAEQAVRVLNDFLNALNWGASDSSQYERAAALYGGSYDTLVEMNPGVDPEDHATLLRNACRVNGLQCLRIREVLSTETVPAAGGGDEFRFRVR